MTTLPGRYQPLDTPRPGSPLRVRDLETAQTLLLREIAVPTEHESAVIARALAAKGIFHPSLVTLFDVIGPTDGRLILAYEFVPAQPAVVVTGGSPLNVRRAAEIVAEVADAVAELHARDIAHGAIALSSLLLTLKGKAKLDRLGDPTILQHANPTPAHDLAALGDLLDELVGPRAARSVVGAQAVETLIDRARAGKFESAATFAALLRRL